MKKLLAITAAAAIIAMAGAAMAAGSNTLTVTASVTGTCKFVTGTSSLTFPALDPSVNAPVAGTTTTNFWCTKGVTNLATVAAADNGSNWSGTKRQMKDSVSGDLIPYTLTLTKDGLTNGGPTVPRTLTIDGGVLYADFSAKSAGTYTDSVSLTINP
jgi:spore coat protein U-like protein